MTILFACKLNNILFYHYLATQIDEALAHEEYCQSFHLQSMVTDQEKTYAHG